MSKRRSKAKASKVRGPHYGKGFIVKRRKEKTAKTSRAIERGINVLTNTNDFSKAARSARLTQKEFKRAISKKRLARNKRGKWNASGNLARRMALYSEGQHVIITVPGIKSAQLVGKYMAAVGKFLRTNKIKYIKPFDALGVRDSKRKFHLFETEPNVLYRLASAGGDVFEQVYRIVL